jgi:tetratricopeptide (TPR) repeat protein
MTVPHERQFLDVEQLLEQSHPRESGMKIWQFLGIFFVIALGSALITTSSATAAGVMSVISTLLMIILMVVLGAISWNMVRLAKLEQARLEGIEELIRLRRWQEAAAVLEELLNKPTRTLAGRVQGLIFLTAVLARYNRYNDAILVQNELLANTPLDGAAAHGIRLARVMAMLHEDHLFDADRAISELRQQVNRASRAMAAKETDDSSEKSSDSPNESTDDAHDAHDAHESKNGDEPKRPAISAATLESESPQSISAGLALVEIYRDVKTGHVEEAIRLFHDTLPSLREQLGHRVADAYALVAKAYDLLDRGAEAKLHYARATLLAPADELHRRYPETAMLSQKYEQSFAPMGVA